MLPSSAEYWNPPHPKDRAPNWFERSSWAERDWQIALNAYWEKRVQLRESWRPDSGASRYSVEYAQSLAESELRRAREDYRRRVIGWWWRLCAPVTPVTPGNEVPNRVAELMAEELYGW